MTTDYVSMFEHFIGGLEQPSPRPAPAAPVAGDQPSGRATVAEELKRLEDSGAREIQPGQLRLASGCSQKEETDALANSGYVRIGGGGAAWMRLESALESDKARIHPDGYNADWQPIRADLRIKEAGTSPGTHQSRHEARIMG